MTDEKNRVSSEVQSNYAFFLPMTFKYGYWRVENSSPIWRREDRLQPEDVTNGAAESREVLSRIIPRLFWATSAVTTLTEGTYRVSDRMEVLVLTVRCKTCPYTRESLVTAIQCLADMLHAGEDLREIVIGRGELTREFEIPRKVKDLLVDRVIELE